MAVNLFKLVGSIYVDSDKANESLKKTDENAVKVGDKLASAGKAATAMGAAATAAAAAAVKGAYDQVQATAEAADQVDKASIRMGVSAEEYQKLAYAAGQSGVEVSTLETAAKTLQKSGSDLDLTSAITQVASIKDESERTAKAMELFGSKAGYQLAPLLAEGSDGIKELTDNAEKLGLVMSDETVSAGVLFGDTMSDLTQAIDGAKNQLGAAFLPVFQTVAELLVSVMPDIQKMAKEMAPILADMLKQLVPMVADVLPLVIDMLPTIVDLAMAVIPPVLELAKVAIPYLIKVVDAFMPVIEGLINFITNVFQGNWKDAWQNIVNVFAGIWETMKAIFTKPINWIIDKLNEFIKYVNKIQIPDWVPAVGGKGLNIPEIPKLKVGIDYVPADNYPALLHKGEQVLTAEEAFAYKQGGNSSSNAELIAELRELRMMFKNGTAKTSSDISNTRELRMANA